ncbi:MAG: hypothetical protein AB8B87_05390 [Granulosicoccus sp.]
MSSRSSGVVRILFGLSSVLISNCLLADSHPGKIVSPASRGQFELLSEPSGVIALGLNSFIVVEDEAKTPLRRLSSLTDNPTSLKFAEFDQPIGSELFDGPLDGPLDDLEGIARVSPTQFIVTGSHESARKGTWPGREKLVLFTLENNEIVSAQIRKNLYKKLKKRYPELRDIMKKTSVRKRQPLNIESIAFDRKRLRLYIGLRTPIADDTEDAEAFVIRLDNALEYLAGGKPVFGERLHRLYLGKGGIRALAYDDQSDKLLIVSRRESGKKKRFMLWSVSADTMENPKRHKSKDKDLFENVEGVTPFSDGVLFIRDNGDQSEDSKDDWFILQRAQLGLDE